MNADRMNFRPRVRRPEGVPYALVLSGLFLLMLAMIFALASCAQLGLTPPQSTLQKAEYVRGTLNGVYDGVVIARKAGKLSDKDKANVMLVAGAVNAELTLVESGNPSTADCLAVINKSLTTADPPQAPIVTAASCLDLATQVITILQTQIGAK